MFEVLGTDEPVLADATILMIAVLNVLLEGINLIIV